MAHIHEKIDFGADTFVVNGNSVLLRIHDKYKEWYAPGGHIELDEDPEEAALREVKEEVGLMVLLAGKRAQSGDPNEKEVLVPRFINRHRINATHEHVCFIYFATSSTREILQGENEKTCEIKWFTKDELADPKYGIKERVQFYARAALDELGS